jgi:hypothetical protein
MDKSIFIEGCARQLSLGLALILGLKADMGQERAQFWSL